MTKNSLVERDERTETVENASYALAYKVLAFGLLFDIMYRSLVLGQDTWDLMGLALVTGVILTGYQWRHAILGKGWTRLTALAVGIGLVVAVLIVVFLSQR